MNNWYELEAYDHQQEILRDIAQIKLAKQARLGDPKINGYQARLGNWLVKVGNRLQVSAQPDCPEFN